MKILRALVLIAAAAVVAVAVVLVWWLRPKRMRRGPTVPNATAAPPFRTPTASDKILARMVNAVNHDMRSLELAQWFAAQLAGAVRASGYACGSQRPLDYSGIAAKVPGANDVTKLELRSHMADLMAEACAGSGKGSLADTLLRFGASAAHPATGVLAGMPGYSVKSAVPLPK